MAITKKSEPVTRTNLEATQKPNRVSATASAGIHTEPQVDMAISAVYSDLVEGIADHNQARLVLSAIGKKLVLENLKFRAGFYKNGMKSFFLPQ